MPIKLYDSKVSPYARKVRLLAAELEIPIEKISLDFQKGDPQKPEYLALNPNGKVPTIDDDGVVVWESIAILKYLAGKKPGLLPADARGRRASGSMDVLVGEPCGARDRAIALRTRAQALLRQARQ